MVDQKQARLEASRIAGLARPRSWPGALGGGAMAIVSGLACWFWLIPQFAAGNPLHSRPGSMAGDLSEVAEDDLAGALSTMNLPGSAAARLQKGNRDCGARLAWVTLSRSDGEAGPATRLRSGAYFSPPFIVTTTPVRVAIPYPAPYDTGHGSLTVLGAAGSLVVALRPAWHVPVNAGTATHEVVWHPVANCSRP